MVRKRHLPQWAIWSCYGELITAVPSRSWRWWNTTYHGELFDSHFMNIDKMSTFLDNLPPYSCKCSLWTTPCIKTIFRKTAKFSPLKFIYSEKATKFCEISTLILSVCTVDKSKAEISQNFVAFSEYRNFNTSWIIPNVN